MRLRALIYTAFFIAFLPSSSSGQTTLTMPSDEILSVFDDFCLHKFPDDHALDVAATARGSALTSHEIKAFLHDDPGVGWSISEPAEKFIVTDEAPPFHACTIRRPSPVPLDGGPFFALAKKFLSVSGESMAPLQTHRTTTPTGLISLEVSGAVLGTNGLATGETFIFLDVRYPSGNKPDGTQTNPTYDIRFVRQIHRQQV